MYRGILLLLLVGCGPKAIVSVPISGTVTLDNAPLKEGIIIFYPDTEGAAPVSAEVKDGKFTAPTVPAGTYKAAVRSQTVDTSTAGASSDTGIAKGPPKPDPIPLKYREPSIPVDLTTSQSDVKIALSSR